MTPVLATWSRQARDAYLAAGLAAELTHWLVTVGVRPDLLVRATQVVSDRVQHAALCRELVIHAGGDPEPIALDPAELRHVEDAEAPLHLRALTAAGELACASCLARAVLRERLANATDPLARDVCAVLLRDAGTHHTFAWELLDELIAMQDAEVVRDWARPRAAGWLRRLLGASPPLDEPAYGLAALGFGLIAPRTYDGVVRRAVKEDMLPRLHERGLLEPVAADGEPR